ncbi:MAG TPA: SH3 domain-containing protein [Candidatus Dormibacteraeota bacterium]|nr:SH3 domain-containing protein [Candidatus Dormibacteraeota bacterium]
MGIMQASSRSSEISRVVMWALFLLACPSCLMAQQATVKRNANLRSDPSTTNPPIELLRSGATVTVLDATPHGGYYHVKAEDGREGWVWSRSISVSGASPTAPQATAPPFTTLGAAVQCDDSLWNHVYKPARLIVKQKCMAVTGKIVDATNGQEPDGVRHEADGDTHGWLKPDPQFKDLLNAGNVSAERGNLVFEIVCKFPVSQRDAKAACPPSYHTPVQIPPVGSHVRMVGTYVQDTHHAQWMEIHPVSSITVIP